MNTSFGRVTRRIAIAVFAISAFASTPASAAPIADLRYVETLLAGGEYRYDYTLLNLGDPAADAGFDAYGLFLSFSGPASLVSATTPTGWDLIAGDGFLDTFSLEPGTAPFGTDIGAGQLLDGFTFVFDTRIGDLPFQVMFANPFDAANPITYDGVAAAAAPPVPEPSSLLLLGSAAASLVLARRRKRAQPPEGC